MGICASASALCQSSRIDANHVHSGNVVGHVARAALMRPWHLQQLGEGAEVRGGDKDIRGAREAQLRTPAAVKHGARGRWVERIAAAAISTGSVCINVCAVQLD